MDPFMKLLATAAVGTSVAAILLAEKQEIIPANSFAETRNPMEVSSFFPVTEPDTYRLFWDVGIRISHDMFSTKPEISGTGIDFRLKNYCLEPEFVSELDFKEPNHLYALTHSDCSETETLVDYAKALIEHGNYKNASSLVRKLLVRGDVDEAFGLNTGILNNERHVLAANLFQLFPTNYRIEASNMLKEHKQPMNAQYVLNGSPRPKYSNFIVNLLDDCGCD